jgi:hypothetical protein
MGRAGETRGWTLGLTGEIPGGWAGGALGAGGAASADWPVFGAEATAVPHDEQNFAVGIASGWPHSKQ